MKILVYNVKGGVGKTSIALNLALELKCGVVTNDIFSPLETVLDEESFLKVADPDLVKADHSLLDDFPEIPDDVDVIYDLGGHIDTRAAILLEQAKWVIVPTLRDYVDLHVTFNFVNQIQEITQKIIMIVNGTVGKEFSATREQIREYFPYETYEIKKSRALPDVFDRRKPLSEIIQDGGLRAYSFKPVNEQFQKLLKQLGGK